MGKNTTNAVVGDAQTNKGKRDRKPSSSKKVQLEILRDNWINLKAYINAYNKDSLRMTPKTDVERVIHEALATHLASNPKG